MSAFDGTLKSLPLAGGRSVYYYSLNALADQRLGDISRFPYSLRILLESLVRLQAHPAYTPAHVQSFARWSPDREDREEYPYLPSRVLLQDFTGVPCVVDLAALRSALKRAGHDPAGIEPQIPVDLVIDHSVQVDESGQRLAFDRNLTLEFQRNRERYIFLRWGQGAFKKLSVLPPGLGICHQVNMEYIARCVSTLEINGRTMAFPDTLVGTDSHTTMINSMGVLGWGVGGIEAEAAMLGQPIPILTPKVTGFRLTGQLPAGVTPTDMALTITQMLRQKGVVDHFVEFFGPGVDGLSLADRAPVANMSPEYGATMGFFPIDAATLEYLRTTGRSAEQIDLVERYCKEQGLFRAPGSPDPIYNQVMELDLSTLEPSMAGPKRPQDRVFVRNLHTEFRKALAEPVEKRGFGLAPDALDRSAPVDGAGTLKHGSVVIAAITSCTNTSNPTLLLGAGILAKKAVERGLKVPAYVKTSLAPGSRVVTEYLKRSGLMPYLEQLGFHVIAYGCTTCIGNSGPLRPEVEAAIKAGDLVTAAVLSGNRNFEGRIHPLTLANYLGSPPLVIAYALKGTVDTDLLTQPLGTDRQGRPVYLKELWPTAEEIQAHLQVAADPELYKSLYQGIEQSSPAWNELSDASSSVYAWDADSTYIREPSFFEAFADTPPPVSDLRDAAVLGVFGDFVTTDHISPAGSIPAGSPAGKYLLAQGVPAEDFNSYGSRRGNHEVMMRGTFANIRIRNFLVDKPGGLTVYHPTGDTLPIYDAAMKYKAAGVPLIVLAGKMYGAGSSRDWAAKGTFLLGVKAVLAESFERIHRSNLVEMGVLPLEFMPGDSVAARGLTGRESFAITGLAAGLTPGQTIEVAATGPQGALRFPVRCRIDSPIEVEYFRHGGILQYVLREVMKKTAPSTAPA
jgi:aconitate hydratase